MASQTAQTTGASPTAYTIAAQDANSRVWQWNTYETSPAGVIVTHRHSYTELASGLNHWVNGQWVESKEQIDILPNGTAVATNGQHQAYFPGDLYTGQIELVTPDGQQLRSRPLGLSYFDGTNTVLIAELTNSIGVVVGNNQVVYPDAFTGFKADLHYTYTKAGFEQDIILRQQPPTPESLGLNPDTARLQILTEFFAPPQPTIGSTPMSVQAGLSLTDETLDFGTMQMVPGKAFLLGANAADAGALVSKHWVLVNGRQILVEEVPVNAILEGLAALPLTAMNSSPNKSSRMAAKQLKLPPQRLAQNNSKARLTAKTGLSAQGFVLDYQTLNTTVSSYTFQGDTTYYISGAASSGATTFEGGAVLKYAVGASLAVNGSSGQLWKADTYRPIIFTAVDDNSVGQSISNSTGFPTNYYAAYALNFNATRAVSVPVLSNFRISYAAIGISVTTPSLVNPTIRDGQFVQCQYAGQLGGFHIYNTLFANIGTNFTGSAPLDMQNVTVANVGRMVTPTTLIPSGYRTENCIYANIGSYGATPAGTNNGFYNCPAMFGTSPVTNAFYPFQPVGAGYYYLTNGCSFLNAGTTAIDATNLADIQTKTTYPPLVYSNTTIYVNTNFTPQAQRDTDVPDLGYHYAPIDYYVEQYTVANATLTVSGGAVIACNNDNGIWLGDGSAINCIGTATTPNWLTYYLCVQEEPKALGPYASFTVCPHTSGGTKPAGVFQFTKFTELAGIGYELYDEAGGYLYGSLLVQDCEFWNGSLELGGPGSSTTVVQNNLFVRAPVDAVDNYYTSVGNYYLSFSNNLFWHLAFEMDQNSTGEGVFYNNDFDSCSFSYGGSNSSTTNGFNAYLNCSGRLSPTNAYDFVTNASLAYQSGPLGNFYQPTNSVLIDRGSTTAANAGLASFTTQTNQALDTGTVDVGYHYAPLSNDSTGTDFWLAYMNMSTFPVNSLHSNELSLCISSAVGASGIVNILGLYTNGPTMIATNCGDASVNGIYVLTNLTAQEIMDWETNGDVGLDPTSFNYVNVNNSTNWANFSDGSWILFGYDPGARQFSVFYDKAGINLNGSATDWYDGPYPGPTTICAQSPAPLNIPFSAAAGGATNVAITMANVDITNVMIMDDDQIETISIHVTASAPVSVYALDYLEAGSAAFTCYPTTLLGTNYCVMARPSLEGGQSEFAIVATANNTTVTITPATNAALYGYKWTNSIILQQGQTYETSSAYETPDVTGTWITADKPVAVFAGADDAYVPAGNIGTANPLVQEQLPAAMWGTNALSMSFAGRLNGDSYRVLAAYNNTVVWTNGAVAGTNQAGGFLDLTNAGPVQFQASQPIQVAHFANGIDFDGAPYGDPCEILLLPTGHYLQTNIVVTLTNDLPYSVIGDFTENYLNVIVPQSAITNTWLDGSLVATTNFVAIWTSGYYGAQLAVTNSGVHTVTSSKPVGVEIYGFGNADACGYFGGVVK